MFGRSSAILRARSRESSIFSPFTSMMTSPALRSVLAAGPSSVTLVIMAPLASCRPIESAMSSLTFWMTTPSQPRSTLPWVWSWVTTSLTRAAGTAKAMPTLPPEGEKMAVLTPITLPSRSKLGPPELPRFTAASICR